MTRFALLLLVLSLSLTACKTAPPPKLPEEAYYCKSWPTAPIGTYGYQEIGRYIVNGHDAWSDCHAKLQAMKP